MKVSFENPDKINGLLTLVVEEDDYKNEVEKTLKDYRKKANVPSWSGSYGYDQAPVWPICKDGGYQQDRRPGDLQVCTGKQDPDARRASPI